MDRNFHIDDFERLLREKSNEFRMYPSKRIWSSIYNNIHPGRKWPSVAMSITLICGLLLVGYLNTSNTNLYIVTGKNSHSEKTFAAALTAQFVSPAISNVGYNPAEKINTLANDNTITLSNKNLPSNNIHHKLIQKPSPVAAQKTILPSPNNVEDLNNNNSLAGINIPIKKQTIIPIAAAIYSLPGLDDMRREPEYRKPADDSQSGALTYVQKTAINDFINTQLVNNVEAQDLKTKIEVAFSGSIINIDKNNPTVNKNNFISTEEKNWIENYALYNRPATKKWANKLFRQLYAAPSVVYRSLYNNPNFGNTLTATPLAISSANQDINNAVIQRPSVGFEVGAGLQYSIFKGVKLKGGLQLNYTRYNADAFQNSHPVATRLAMHDYVTNTTYEEYRTTPYSNKNGIDKVKLHNETFQISIPLGADIKLIGNENLQLNLGATIQPTYVIGGKSYLLSYDRRNYVKETSMLNHLNLNAGFETFITYKVNGLIFQLGPQFRTQLFSTNTKKFAIEERLVNYGLKFGISKTIK